MLPTLPHPTLLLTAPSPTDLSNQYKPTNSCQAFTAPYIQTLKNLPPPFFFTHQSSSIPTISTLPFHPSPRATRVPPPRPLPHPPSPRNGLPFPPAPPPRVRINACSHNRLRQRVFEARRICTFARDAGRHDAKATSRTSSLSFLDQESEERIGVRITSYLTSASYRTRTHLPVFRLLVLGVSEDSGRLQGKI